MALIFKVWNLSSWYKMLTGVPGITLTFKESKDVGGGGKGVMVETFDHVSGGH